MSATAVHEKLGPVDLGRNETLHFYHHGRRTVALCGAKRTTPLEEGLPTRLLPPGVIRCEACERMRVTLRLT